MKGIIYNLLETVVHRHYGEDVWDGLLESAELGGSYTSLGSYPDEDLYKLVEVASQSLGLTTAQVLCWFGREAIPILAQRYPGFFDEHQCTQSFILSVNDIIHPEVRKLYPGADVPEFDYSEGPDGDIFMGYYSARRLCALAQGFVEGSAAYYAEQVVFEHVTCMHDGDPKCLFRMSFAKDA